MASATNEAKILFKAETAEFESSLKSAQSEMSTLRAEMKLAEATFKATGDAAEYQKSKTEILESQLEANAQKQEALTQKLEAAKAIYGEDSEEVAKLERALTNAKTEEQNLTAQLKDTNSGLGEQKEAAEEAGDKMQGLSEVIVAAGIADKLQEIGQAAYDMAAEFDDASAAIVEGTGASGDVLDELNEAAQNAFGSLANDSGSIGDVANTLAELNTRFGLTGDAAEDATVKFSNFADHTGTDGVKAVDSIANIMHRWGMDIDDLDPLLDDLTTANQSCQMSVDDLTGYLANNSTQFQELGYSSEEALAMLISLSDGGADVGSVMSGLTKGIANLSGETDDVPGAFQAAVKAISESGSVSEALEQQVGDTGKTVEEVFGKKAAQELATNIQNGAFAVDKWKTALENNDGALQATTENATTMSDSWSQAVNNVQMALGTTFAPAIQAVVTALANFITPIAQFIQQSPIAQAAIVGIATVLGILGAALAIGAVITAVSARAIIFFFIPFSPPISFDYTKQFLDALFYRFLRVCDVSPIRDLQRQKAPVIPFGKLLQIFFHIQNPVSPGKMASGSSIDKMNVYKFLSQFPDIIRRHLSGKIHRTSIDHSSDTVMIQLPKHPLQGLQVIDQV